MLIRKLRVFLRFFPIALFWLIIVLLLIWMTTSCQSSQESSGGFFGKVSQTTASGIKYIFLQQNIKGRKAGTGDLITFHLIVQNHQDSVLSSTYHKYKGAIQELPFEENYFIHKPLYRDIFGMVAEGDSLIFWIPVDSIARQVGFMKSAKTPNGSLIRYTTKILKIRSKVEIKAELQKNMQAQQAVDDTLIERYLADEVKKKAFYNPSEKLTRG
jgi:hypothetical protein